VNEWSGVFLGVIAVAVTVMAIVQVGVVIFGARLAKRVEQIAQQVDREIKPLLVNLNVVGQEAAARRQFLCTVTVDLGGSRHIKTQARAMHPGAAIDRAADRTAWLIGRRIGRDCSVKSPAFSS